MLDVDYYVAYDANALAHVCIISEHGRQMADRSSLISHKCISMNVGMNVEMNVGGDVGINGYEWRVKEKRERET